MQILCLIWQSISPFAMLVLYTTIKNTLSSIKIALQLDKLRITM